MSHWSTGETGPEDRQDRQHRQYRQYRQDSRGHRDADPEQTQPIAEGDGGSPPPPADGDPDATRRIPGAGGDAGRPGSDPDATRRIGGARRGEAGDAAGSRAGDRHDFDDHGDFDYFFEPRRPPEEDRTRAFQTRQSPQAPPQRSPQPPQRPGPPAGGGRGGAARSARPARRRRGGFGRKLLAVLGVLVLLLGAALVYADLRLTKVQAFEDYEGRPPVTPGQDWLLVGSDSRQGLSPQQRRELSTGGGGSSQRTDTIMLLHIPRFGAGQPTLVSLPRDSAVDIPAYTDDDGNRHPARRAKINAAFAYGGPELLARTVETETGIRLDRYMEMGFGGFVGMVEAVGGVRMCLDEPIQDRRAGIELSAGCQQLNGRQALGFVRARYFDPRGDFGRVQRQRRFMQALASEASNPATLLNPIAMTNLVNAGTGALVVDNGTGPPALLWFAYQMKRLTGGNGVTMTVPSHAAPVQGLGSAVVWEREKAVALFDALRNDQPVPQSLVPKRGQG